MKLIGTAGAGASVSGCSGILGGCGPGDDEIGTVTENVNATASAGAAGTVSITGEIRSVGETDIVVDDGTGTAKLTTLFGSAPPRNVDDGDCARASGVPFPAAPDSDYDVRLLVERLGPADD